MGPNPTESDRTVPALRLFVSVVVFEEIRDLLMNAGYYWLVDEATPDVMVLPEMVLLREKP